MSDLHLGNYRGPRFARRMVKMANRLNPDVVFIAGDLYDGTPGDLARMAEPLSALKPALGSFFVEGNHEEFSDSAKYLKAVASAGVRVLVNEVVVVDGLQVLGVTYRDATHGEHFRKVLRATGFDRSRPVFCWSTRPTGSKYPRKKAFRCSFPGTRTTANSGRGRWLPRACTANMFTGCSASARCRFTPRAAQAPGDRRCASATIPKLWPSALSSKLCFFALTRPAKAVNLRGN